MFALPAMYEEVVNNNNAKLAKYVGCILSEYADTELELDAAQKALLKFKDDIQDYNNLAKIDLP